MPAAFVIKAEELTALNFLSPDDPRPQAVEWIDRGTDRALKPSSVDMLLRTLHLDIASKSVVRLHRSAGLRTIFRTEEERDRFAIAFARARELRSFWALHTVSAIFEDRTRALKAMADLRNAGIPQRSISIFSQASHFLEKDFKPGEGHSLASVAGSMAGGGLAGVMLGLAILAIPGIGAVGIASALASTTGSELAIFSGVAGATGAAIAKMLTDHDVDGVSASLFAQRLRRGKIFVSVETGDDEEWRKVAWATLRKHGGRAVNRS